MACRRPFRRQMVAIGPILLLAITLPGAAEDHDSSAKEAAKKAKSAIRRATSAFDRTVNVGRCSVCKGNGKVSVGRLSVTGFTVSGSRDTEECPHCKGRKWSVKVQMMKAAARKLSKKYNIHGIYADPKRSAPSESEEYPLDAALSVQHSLECYLDLLDLVDQHSDLVASNKRLSDKVKKAREYAKIAFGNEAEVLEALAYAIAHSSADVEGAGVCLVGRITQTIGTKEQRYAKVEIADQIWLISIPEGKRWTSGASIRVIGRVAEDLDYAAVLGADRAATTVKAYDTDF